MSLGLVAQPYCHVCGTVHTGPAGCPGDLRATGAERPGWRVNIETPVGREAIGVLLAPTNDRWRARIVTFPNVLWTIPGGRGTIKFVGDTAEEAEAQAVLFVERHVLARRNVRRQAPARSGIASGTAKVRRKLRCLPVRFGTERALTRGATVNLSTEGMFIRVLQPEDSGQSLLIHLDLKGHTLALRGVVMWNRLRAEPERPAGMGIRLSDPPPLYQAFVDELP